MDALIFLGMVIVGLWVLPTGLSYRMASDKGYEPALGIVLGLFLGWLGFLICCTLTDKRKVAGTTRPCPYCAEQIQTAAKLCRFCGREVEATVS